MACVDQPEPPVGAGHLHITATCRIPYAALGISASRSSGPGGQHVNTTASRVSLRVSVFAIEGLAPDARQRLMALAGSRLVGGDCLLIHAQAERSQQANKAAAMDELVRLVRRALVRPIPRRATKPTAGSTRRRLQAKKHRSGRKAGRQAPDDDADG